VRRSFQACPAHARAQQHDRSDDGKEEKSEDEDERDDLVPVDAA